MAKSLCKYRRVEIADQFTLISKLVSEPKFICSSCARSASDKAYLCKPSALSARALAAVPAAVPKGVKESVTVSELPAPTPAVQANLATISMIEDEHAAAQPTVTKKQANQLKKLAKKKNKRLKKAAKAVQRYERALQKAKKALQL